MNNRSLSFLSFSSFFYIRQQQRVRYGQRKNSCVERIYQRGYILVQRILSQCMRFSCSHNYRHHLLISSYCCYLFAFSFFAYLAFFFLFFFYHNIPISQRYSGRFSIFHLRFPMTNKQYFYISCQVLFSVIRLLTKAILQEDIKNFLMSGWDQYIINLTSQGITHAGIFGADGSRWAASSNFPVCLFLFILRVNVFL